MSDEIEDDAGFPSDGGNWFIFHVRGRGGAGLTVQLEERNVEDVKWTDLADVAADPGGKAPSAGELGETIRLDLIVPPPLPTDWSKFYLPPGPPPPRAADPQPQAGRAASDASIVSGHAEEATPGSAPGSDDATANPPPSRVSGRGGSEKHSSVSKPRERGTPNEPGEMGLDRKRT